MFGGIFVWSLQLCLVLSTTEDIASRPREIKRATYLKMNFKRDLLFPMVTTVCAVLCYHFLVGVCQCVVLLLVGYYWYKVIKKYNETRIGGKGQGILVTGCDTGIGHHAALRMESLGFTVFAGCLDPHGEGATKLRSLHSDLMHVLEMDITRDEHIAKAVDYVQKYCRSKGLWAVINNAAINRLGDIELVTMETIKHVSEVNYFGMVRVTKAFLPMIKASKGRIINVTSVRGRIAVPTDVCYTPTKWAGEAFSDILRREMYRFGVKVIIIEPGNFGGLTGMLNQENIERNVKSLSHGFEAASPQTRSSYGTEYVEMLIHGLKECGKTTHPTLLPVMEGIEHAVTSSMPHCRYLIQGSNKLFDWYCVVAFLNPYLPEEIMDYFLRVIDPLPPVAEEAR